VCSEVDGTEVDLGESKAVIGWAWRGCSEMELGSTAESMCELNRARMVRYDRAAAW
jgi:hypothetical protein